jgi:hypothetical protein
MINHMGQINITHLAQLGYKPGRLIDIWEMKFGRSATGCCAWCQSGIHPMRIMRKCGRILGCYPSSAECFVVVNAIAYPGIDQMKMLTHRQRAELACLVCQSCWMSMAGGNTLIAPGE